MSAPLVFVGSALLFGLQLLLLLKTKKNVIRLIPVYLICAMLAYAVATYLGVFGTYSAGAVSGNELAGVVLLMISGVEAIGPLLAWIVYGATLLMGKKKYAGT